MNLEPQKFFIGLLDFFSILLSGALLMEEAGPAVPGGRYASLSDGSATLGSRVPYSVLNSSQLTLGEFLRH